jgi:hypothetical protein
MNVVSSFICYRCGRTGKTATHIGYFESIEPISSNLAETR